MEKRFRQHTGGGYNNEASKRNGEIHIDHIPQSENKKPKHADENYYTDFEEIHDDDNKS